MEALNLISLKQDKEKYKYVLLDKTDDQEKFFGDIYTYVPLFMCHLWENPKIVAKLLINSKKEDLKSNIAPLIVNNFYENILSSSYIEDYLLYVIGIVLKDEIDNQITQKNDYKNFLEDTPCGIILEELKMKQDVQTFFKSIIYDIVSHLEEENSSYEINFNVKNIQEEFNKTKEVIESEYKKTGKKQKIITVNFFRKNTDDLSDFDKMNDESELFNSKYIPSFTIEEFKALLNKNEMNKFMHDFLMSQYQMVKENPNVFSNETFLKNVFESAQSKEILASYQIDFTKTIKILDEFLKTLLKNLYLLPYSVKCI